jgi:hypothetical protein
VRYTADQFWLERGDVAPTRWQTANDLLREAFLAGATEADARGSAGTVTVAVAGIGWWDRFKLARHLNEEAPVGTRVYVTKLKGNDG